MEPRLKALCRPLAGVAPCASPWATKAYTLGLGPRAGPACKWPQLMMVWATPSPATARAQFLQHTAHVRCWQDSAPSFPSVSFGWCTPPLMRLGSATQGLGVPEHRAMLRNCGRWDSPRALPPPSPPAPVRRHCVGIRHEATVAQQNVCPWPRQKKSQRATRLTHARALCHAIRAGER